jgi:hypothetical protein
VVGKIRVGIARVGVTEQDLNLTRHHNTTTATMSDSKHPDPELAKEFSLAKSPSSHSASSQPVPIEGTISHLPTFAHEKSLCWKFDLRMLPMLALMYLFNALDKGNLGNAKTDGMDKDLGFVGNQYNTMLSIFYVPYVVFAPPIGMLGKKYGPNRVLPTMMFCFGSATLLAASVKNWSGMMALRWFLGTLNSLGRGVLRLEVRLETDTAQVWLSLRSSHWLFIT